ncbi:hypothetical protein [Metabacillus idriensis]|uniref:hypothetical protein n=1 Tax=Metabacillus idriensis TaxID=324768 RepID=UPI00174BAB50|nr:hypothetical protein [Metabacillus idriensis]
MIIVKKDEFMNTTYPPSYKCACGRQAELSITKITTKYQNAQITVSNVPVYECGANHVKMARLTRVKMHKLLKKAFENNINEIDFEDKKALLI